MNIRSDQAKDVVCGMMINSDTISLDYQGCHFAFCSKQCLQRFKSNPHLYIGYPGHEAPKHAGVEVLKKRTLKLAEALPSDIADQLVACIRTMMGIKAVSIDGEDMFIVYDLLQATEAQIEQALSDAGIILGEDLMEKIRRAFVHYMEETECESLEVPSTSTSKHCH